jgi:hypothetical protein
MGPQVQASTLHNLSTRGASTEALVNLTGQIKQNASYLVMAVRRCRGNIKI